MDFKRWSKRIKTGWAKAKRDPRAWVLLLVMTLVSAWFGPNAARWVDNVWDGRRVAAHQAMIERHAEAAGLPVKLVSTVVMAESSGNATAESNRGAKGLMQITPITEKDVLQRNAGWEQGDLFDPDYNLKIGTTYLAYLLDRFDGDLMLAMTAYHMGPTAVRRIQREHEGITPEQLVADHAGPMTRAYVKRVLTEMGE